MMDASSSMTEIAFKDIPLNADDARGKLRGQRNIRPGKNAEQPERVRGLFQIR
jgi:hypothetical protein